MKTWQKALFGVAVAGAVAFAPKKASGEFLKYFDRSPSSVVKIAEDSLHVAYSQKSLNMYKGMKIFQNQLVKDLLEDPAIVSKTGADERVADLVALKKKCAEGGLTAGEIETLINTLKNSH